MDPSGALPRRLTQDALSALRRRRTGVGRAVRRPLQAREGRRQRTDVSDSASGTDDSDDEDDGSGGDDITCMEIMTCCWGPRCCVSMCMLLITLVGWSAAITYGIVKQPSYDQIVTPMRVARQRYFNKMPENAEEGFILFDRNADGLIGVDDLIKVAKVTTGETVPISELHAYIAKGDVDGDGFLDEAEYLAMLQQQRVEKGGSGAPPAGHG